jgi:hypothetical protein
MPRVALPDSSQQCRIYGCLYTPHDQDLHIFMASSSTNPNIATTATTSSAISSFDAPFKTLLGILGYWELLFKASSRSACLQKLP